MNSKQSKILKYLVPLLLAIVIPVGLYQLSVQPGAALVKLAFESSDAVNLAEFASEAELDKELIQSEFEFTTENSHLSYGVFQPKQSSANKYPLLIWIHGGGFISGYKEQIYPYAKLVANKGYVVASLDYTLAPQAKHPQQLIELNLAIKDILANAEELNFDPNKVFIAGDSAGAHLAGELTALQTNSELAKLLEIEPALNSEQLNGVLLFCGLYDLRTVAETNFPALRTYLWSYTGVRNWLEYPLISALNLPEQLNSQFPSVFITVGDSDPFESQATELVAELAKHSIEVDKLFWTENTGLGHEYQFDFTKTEAELAFERVINFLNTKSAGEN